MKKIVAIAVAYHPEATAFSMLLERLLAQASLVVVVDNTPGDQNPLLVSLISAQSDHERCRLVRLKTNTGIASAINIGLQAALTEGADFVLLSDQDSLPSIDMVENLCRVYAELTAQGVRVGAIGPTFLDLNTSLTFPFQADLPGKFFYGHKGSTVEEPHVEALSLITSGSLIPAEVIQVVGPMREDFFIDNVDVEWCHRARSMGYRIFGTGWATMYQRLGEAKLRVWYLRWRYESEYSPIRSYYRLRNLVALWKLDFIDWRWKVRNTWYGLGVVYTHTFFAKKQNAKHLLMAAKGVWHGLTNRMGPYKEE